MDVTVRRFCFSLATIRSTLLIHTPGNPSAVPLARTENLKPRCDRCRFDFGNANSPILFQVVHCFVQRVGGKSLVDKAPCLLLPADLLPVHVLNGLNRRSAYSSTRLIFAYGTYGRQSFALRVDQNSVLVLVCFATRLIFVIEIVFVHTVW